MGWTIEWDKKALRQLGTLDTSVQKKIHDYLKKIISHNNPRAFGRGLTGDKSGWWRYRVGDYRVVCHLENHRLVVVIIAVGHRKEIYD